MKIYAPVKDANGVWASVLFVNGVGETDKPHLIKWFMEHGYKVEKELEKCEDVLEKALEKCDEPVEPEFEKMTPNELRDWMKENGFGSQMKNIRNKDKLIEIIRG